MILGAVIGVVALLCMALLLLAWCNDRWQRCRTNVLQRWHAHRANSMRQGRSTTAGRTHEYFTRHRRTLP